MTPVAWRQAPEVPAADASMGPAWRAFLVPVVVAGPLVRTWALPAANVGLVAATTVAATLAILVLPERWWPVHLVVPVAAAGALVGSEGEQVAVWLALALWAADWGVLGRRPVPWMARPPSSTVAPVVVLSLVATVQGLWWSARWGPILAVGAAVALTVLATVGGPLHRRLEAVLERFSTWVGRWTARVGFGAIGVAVVVLPWALQRPLGIDPLSRGAAPGWGDRRRHDPKPTEPWSVEPMPHRSLATRLRDAVPAVVLVVAAVAGVRLVQHLDPLGRLADVNAQEVGSVPAAHEGEPFYDELSADMAWVMDERVAWNPFVDHRLDDVATRHVNVVDGYRVSWEPPGCEACPTRRVWLYGGSALFGIGQRDGGTIPSALARVANEAGVRLEVANRGIPGQQQWSEVNRLAWDLTVEDPPDLIVFYDGYNEIWSARELNSEGLGDSRKPLDPTIALIAPELRAQRGDPPPRPDGASLTATTVPPIEEVELGDLAVARYERSRASARALADAAGVPVRWFWQPTQFTRGRVEGEPAYEDEPWAYAIEPYVRAGELLDPEVTNLQDVFDDVEGPLFTDDVHHNERGARIVAEAMYPTVAEALGVEG